MHEPDRAITAPRFPATYCSQCGKDLGPGDEGVSHCSDHALQVEQASASPQAEWRCFHCEEVFTDHDAALAHFGSSEYQRAICTIPAEHFRWMEEQHRRNVDDDSEALRTIRGLAGEHEALRRRAEEEGYARGLADAKKYPGELGLCRAAMSPASPAGERQLLSDEDMPPEIEGRMAVWLTLGKELHPLTVNLVVRFARALSAKLADAEQKYGYSDGWRSPEWMDECRAKLMEHIAKGDPRDVAAYCAFLWHHGESTAAVGQVEQQPAPVAKGGE